MKVKHWQKKKKKFQNASQHKRSTMRECCYFYVPGAESTGCGHAIRAIADPPRLWSALRWPSLPLGTLWQARNGRWWFRTFGHTDQDQSQDLPGGTVDKNLPANAGDTGLIPRKVSNAEEWLSPHAATEPQLLNLCAATTATTGSPA